MRINLSKRDFIKGLVVAIVTAFLMAIVAVIEDGSTPTSAQWRTAAIAALAAGISYLLKNIATDKITEAKSILRDASARKLKQKDISNLRDIATRANAMRQV